MPEDEVFHLFDHSALEGGDREALKPLFFNVFGEIGHGRSIKVGELEIQQLASLCFFVIRYWGILLKWQSAQTVMMVILAGDYPKKEKRCRGSCGYNCPG